MAEPRLEMAHRLGSRRRTRDVLGSGEEEEAAVGFGSLLLSRPVLEGLEAAGFRRPSPVQLKAIPLGRCGLDLIVQAKSGTGKTCVFSTVALDSLILENPGIQILVLAPTREIAVQIHSVIIAIGIKLEGLECHVFIGGTPLTQDKLRLKKCHIAVGSPGRIKQLIEIGYLNTASIRLFILDEADKLLEEGNFQEQINWIYSSLPANKQMLAVSATYPESLASALTRYMRDPTFVRLNASDPALIGLTQYYKVVNSHPLPHKTFEEKVHHLQELFSRVPFNQALVFSNLHSRAQRLADILTSKGFPALCISGSMNQNQRLDAMTKLKQFHCRVLISTDLTSRGIDAEKVNLVINLDVPQDWETYLHRIGRAGRFGTYGLAVTYCCRGEEETLMESIAQKCNLQLCHLPDPIPHGLMEEYSDWDIEVTTVEPTNGSLKAQVSPPRTLEVPARALDVPMIESTPPESRAASSEAASRTTKMKVKKTVKQKHSAIGGPAVLEKEDVAGNSKGLNSGTKQGERSKKYCDSRGQDGNSESRDKEMSQAARPKIPCLASFKRHPVWAASFADLVEDYEHFIKEGLEKCVEVIRVYTGPGEPPRPGRGGEPEVKQSTQGVWSDHSSSGGKRSSQGDSESERDSFSASTSSDSEENRSSAGTSPAEEGEVGREGPSSGGEPLPAARADPAPAVSTDRASLGNLHPVVEEEHHLTCEKLVKPSAKRFRKSQVNQALSPLPRGHDGGNLKEDLDRCSYENAERFPYGSRSYEEYWKSYYQAWQNYYAAASNPYYRSFYKRSNWVTAYHMHSVYLRELLKE
ncbi:probable ATP-dependent RNA helicase DDX20 [Rhinatrema bivittatum]|uniref:probable ATP-dependent RNA helicase DDX20 n=1 Tax=Rhinatrema bivittatum TaxID=194408 RepID=UPI00112B0116|nr:probable ATP-dependent RNA helicase DDX20 [Rhinatrema bivittatum]